MLFAENWALSPFFLSANPFSALSLLPCCTALHCLLPSRSSAQVIDSAGVCKEAPSLVPAVNPVTKTPNAAYGFSEGTTLECAPRGARCLGPHRPSCC